MHNFRKEYVPKGVLIEVLEYPKGHRLRAHKDSIRQPIKDPRSSSKPMKTSFHRRPRLDVLFSDQTE